MVDCVEDWVSGRRLRHVLGGPLPLVACLSPNEHSPVPLLQCFGYHPPKCRSAHGPIN
jgi:hypothetical protein